MTAPRSDGDLAPAPGRLLVANPLLPDPNFDRTVVLLLAGGADGALGLVLNRPSETDVAAPLPEWEPLAAEPAVLFVGGPVQHQAVICLARTSGGGSDAVGGDGWTTVLPGVGTVDLDAGLADGTPRFERVRLFAGYAGWGAGQLEAEIDAGAWWVVAADPGDPFSDRPDRLWETVLRRQRFPLAFVSWFPEDPAAN